MRLSNKKHYLIIFPLLSNLIVQELNVNSFSSLELVLKSVLSNEGKIHGNLFARAIILGVESFEFREMRFILRH